MDKAEELAKDICEACSTYKNCINHSMPCSMAYIVADNLYNKKGYVKTTQDSNAKYSEDTWIKPADRMPKERQKVMCLVGLCSTASIKEGCYTGTYWDMPNAYGRVIAWRPKEE